MNIIIHLFLLKSVFGQDWISKPGIDLLTLYNKQYDNIDGPKDPIEDLTSSSKNGIDILSLYHGQRDGSNNTDLIETIQNLAELGNNAPQDDTDYIERPCRIFDKNCIRRYFAAHSLCTPKYQAVPDPVYRSQSTFYLPRVNVTVTPIDIYYTGATARIIEFYVNKKTNRLLLAFTFTNFTTSTDNSYFRFNRRGKEPVVTRSSVDVQYISLTATVTIPNLSNLRLDRSEMYLYSEDINPGLRVDLSIFESTELNVQRSLVEFLLRPDVNLQEAFLIDANFYANSYIQQSICDFGLILS
ncbi:unnamed protein product [Pieris macdunnoughi]|uniref:Uncharacterized protein n=1 Tax=Pieris macdunnoughi TaxID=345717 RepID=A0A821M554_9NEOP|nr:unnamed protein product [Pieris macdunnoughi]